MQTSDFFSSPTFLLIVTVLVFGAPVLFMVIKWADTHIDTFITAHVANKTLANVLVRLNDTVWTLVSNAENTVVADAKAKSGGALSAADGQKIKDDVISQLKALWGQEGLKEIMDVVGISTDTALATYIGAKVETAVAAQGSDAGPHALSPVLP